jgi:hypothetical protein
MHGWCLEEVQRNGIEREAMYHSSQRFVLYHWYR